MTSFLSALRRPFPPLAVPGLGIRRFRLEGAVAKLEQQFGTANSEGALRPDVFKQVEEALQGGPDAIQSIPRSLLVYVPHAMLYAERTGRDHGPTVAAYLRRLDSTAGKWTVKSLWTHYLLSFEHADPATKAIAGWLRQRVDMLPESFRRFSDLYHLFEPPRSVGFLAEAALEGRLARDIAGLGIPLDRLRVSSLLVIILGGVGLLLRKSRGGDDPIGAIVSLLEGDIAKVLDRPKTDEALRKRALGSFIDGLIHWQVRRTESPEETLRFLLEINEDPRFIPGRWNGVASSESISTVEAWLSQKTIDAFFNVIDRLNLERKDMWSERRAFWTAYLPHIRRAWLIVGVNAQRFADEEEIRYGTFYSGASANHCGLLLEFNGLSVLEMNMTGRAVFWKPDQVKPRIFPTVYDDKTPYNRAILTRHVPSKEVWRGGCIGLSHHAAGWQPKFRDLIERHTTDSVLPEEHQRRW